jgi:hypothetical protein
MIDMSNPIGPTPLDRPGGPVILMRIESLGLAQAAILKLRTTS